MSLRHKEDSISLIRDKESINSKDRVKIIPYGEEPPLGETDVNRPCLFMCIKEVDAEGQPTAIEFRDCHGHVYPASSPELLKYLSGAPLNYSGTPVSIAYAGTNRIASITAYGENAQGGTTEAPVALTGVDSVHVCGRNLLPLPYSQVSETKNGLNIAVNADGTITVSGTATAETYLNLKPIPASLYRLMGVTGITPAYDYPVTKNGFTFFDLTIQPHVEFALVYIVITKGSVVNRTYRPYIIKSAEPLPYETYQGSVTPLPIPRPLRRVGDVKDKCVTRQDYESAEKLVVTYNVGFVELDGTEDVMFYDFGNFKRLYIDLDSSALSRYSLKFSHGEVNTVPTIAGGLAASFNQDALNRLQIISSPDTWASLGVTDTATAKSWLAAQKAAGTPVQVAYQLATPETYATDPVDFDNAAGPLIIMTGGELEVRMTELVGSRSPELTGKMDKATYDADGDGVVDRAADSVKLAGLTPIIDNPSSTNNRNTWYFPFTGTNNKDGTRKYYAALYADEATRAANKVGGGALVDTNDGRLSNARRASNITMGYDGNLWISYS